MSLKIDGKINNSILKIKLIGDLDIYTSDKLKSEVNNYLNGKILDIEIDAEELEFIDSIGLGILISIFKELKDNEKKIYIKNAKPNVRKIFDITDLDKLFIFRGESDEN